MVPTSLQLHLLTNVIRVPGALAYAELGAIIPKNGGEYAYFYEGLHALHPFFGPLPGFIFIWVNTILLKPSSFAILTLTFSTYLLTPIWSDLVKPDYGHEDYEVTSKWANNLVAIACVGERTAAPYDFL
jgi:amino acid transporter